MTSGWLIAFCLLYSLYGVFVIDGFSRRNMIGAAKLASAVAWLTSAYCVIAGLMLHGVWQDPFVHAAADQLGQGAADF
jgi:hypothetical protein